MANRFVMAPMTRGFSPGGVPGADVVKYYRCRASLGLIVSEGIGVDHPAALGVSAIGKIGPTYSQNYRELEDYYAALDRDVLPIMRGMELNADDLVRRAIIQALMCHFELAKKSFNSAYLIDFDRYFATELKELREYEREGLLEISPQSIRVTPKGRMLIRNICMVFDKYLRTRQEHALYSKVI